MNFASKSQESYRVGMGTTQSVETSTHSDEALLPRKKNKKLFFILSLVILSVITAIGVGVVVWKGKQPTPLRAAYEKCGPKYSFKLYDDDTSMEIDGKPAEAVHGVTWEDTECILDALEAPKSIGARMSKTRALDGMQRGEWGDYEATWTYHPDDGLDVIINTKK